MATWIRMKEAKLMWWKARKNNFGIGLEETCSCSILHHELWKLKHLVKIIIRERLHLWHEFRVEVFFDYVRNVHISYACEVYHLLIFYHSKEELGGNVLWFSVMMSKIQGISLNFCLLLGFGDDFFVVMWSLSATKCRSHIMFLYMLRNVSNVELGSSVDM